MKQITKPLVLSLISGILFSISWPTYGIPFFIFFAFIPILIIEQRLRTQPTAFTKMKVFGYSYLSFFIWNCFTTSWLYYATPFGVTFAILANALLMSFVFLLFHCVAQKNSINRALIFLITLWISFEKMHLEWDFSWPWLNIGNVFSEYPQLIQWYEITGTHGGSLWILTINILIFKAINYYATNQKLHTIQYAIISAVIIFPIIYSLLLYYNYTIDKSNPKEVILIQPNVNPYTEKYGESNASITKSILKQTDSLITPRTDYVITPETVLAEHTALSKFNYSTSNRLLREYLKKQPNTAFLLGYDTYELIRNEYGTDHASNQIKPNLWVNYYNAAIQIDTNQLTLPRHFKSKLVVGVENLPYKQYLKPLLQNFMINLGGTLSSRSIQETPSVFQKDSTCSVAPVICYESVYGEYVGQYIRNGAQFIAIMTNDAWWNDTQGHKQHLSIARIRAIETRKDIARSANTGISAFINQRGDLIQQTTYNEKTALIGTVHLNKNETLYVKYGDFIARISFFIALTIGLVSLTKRRFKL